MTGRGGSGGVLPPFDSIAFRWAAEAVRREQKALREGLRLVMAEEKAPRDGAGE